MKWLSFPGTLALKNPEQWLSTTGQVAQPGAENPRSLLETVRNNQEYSQEARLMKINLKVRAEFDIDGSIRPTSIVWEDGRVFAIDRILDIRRAASLKAGGMGMRYTCRICGKVVNLFNDENHWFMEA